MPGYGIVGKDQGAGLLPWSFVAERMAAAHNYWVSSTSRDRKPHAAPVWGLWHEDSFYFSTGQRSRKGRNFGANPAVVVHLESGDEVVILEGKVEEITDKDLLKALDKAYRAKYGTGLIGPGLIYRLHPQRGFAWREADFTESATRWTFK